MLPEGRFVRGSSRCDPVGRPGDDCRKQASVDTGINSPFSTQRCSYFGKYSFGHLSEILILSVHSKIAKLAIWFISERSVIPNFFR